MTDFFIWSQHFVRLFWIFIVVMVVSSCASKPHSERANKEELLVDGPSARKGEFSKFDPQADGQSTDAEEDQDDEDAESEEDDDEANVPSPEVFEEGFCRDDVYARYLSQEYLTKFPAKKVKQKSAVSKRGKKSRDSENSRDVEALYYARSRIVGNMVPYFGALPVVSNPQVERWLRYFKTTGQQAYLKWKVRGESFREVVEPLLKQEGLPQELFFLAMVESGFNNQALSHARATGPWQFMKGTGQLYGLKVGHWVDERRDPVKSTIAAARYLRDLYEDFGDWYLAMASYNAGPGKIRKAIRKTGSSNFWDIAESKHIRSETKNYVPKVLAALILSSTSDAKAYRVDANPVDHTPTTTVTVSRPVQIEELAFKLGIPKRAVEKWNPELVKGITPPTKSGAGYKLRLPEKFAAKFPEIEPQLSELKITDVLMHKIKKGETLGRIASRYGTKIRDLQTLNPGLSSKALKVGREIAIPVAGVVSRSPRQASLR